MALCGLVLKVSLNTSQPTLQVTVVELVLRQCLCGFRNASENFFQMEPDIDSEVTMVTGNSPESSFDSYSDIQSSTIQDFSDDSESNLQTQSLIPVRLHLIPSSGLRHIYLKPGNDSVQLFGITSAKYVMQFAPVDGKTAAVNRVQTQW